jgi:hypothetical protein
MFNVYKKGKFAEPVVLTGPQGKTSSDVTGHGWRGHVSNEDLSREEFPTWDAAAAAAKKLREAAGALR